MAAPNPQPPWPAPTHWFGETEVGLGWLDIPWQPWHGDMAALAYDITTWPAIHGYEEYDHHDVMVIQVLPGLATFGPTAGDLKHAKLTIIGLAAQKP